MHYWLMGLCMKQFERIYKAPEFKPLRDDIELILKLPRPSSAEI